MPYSTHNEIPPKVKELDKDKALHYNANVDLPAELHVKLPEPALSIYRDAFNSAWDGLGLGTLSGQLSREEQAHAAAWEVIARQYAEGADGVWRPKA